VSLAEEIRPDVDVVDELKRSSSPKALYLRWIRMEAVESHKASDYSQLRMLRKLHERGLCPTSVTWDEVVVLDQADDVRTGEPDRPIEDPDFMDIVGENEEVIGSNQERHPPGARTVQGAVVADDQLVTSEAPEPSDELANVGHAIE
jgi:hypothetical protein